MISEPIKTVLPNGLTIILQESHAAPVVAMNLCCRVGSRLEKKGEEGICHVIEHMIFKGTPTYPVGEIARRVEASGGDINAYTSFDETVFYISMATRYMNDGLDILIDAALNPLFDAEELDREKEVVVEEISRSEDSPMQQLGEDLFKIAFTRHPYGNPIAGTRESVRTIGRKQLVDFYKRWYVGPNLVFVMAGDFDAKRLLPQLKKRLSPFPKKSPPQISIPKEPKQQRPRGFVRTMEVQGHYLALAFHAPALTHPDVPALDTLAHILAGGETSRLDQELCEKKSLVSSIQAECYTPQDPCLFLIEAHLNGRRPEPTLQAIAKEIGKIQESPVSPAELARAKTNLKSSLIYERETVEGLCGKIGFFEITAGDYRLEKQYYQRIDATTPEKIQEVAARYLAPARANIVYCHPKKGKQKIAVRQLLAGFPTKRPTPKPAKNKKRHDIESYSLPRGIRLLVKSNPLVPLVSFRSTSFGGLRFESTRTNGLSNLISEILTKGTKHRSALEIATEIEGMAGGMAGYSGRNLIGLQATFLSEKLNEGLNLFTDVLCNPSFTAEELQKERRHILTAIRDQGDSLGRVAMREFLQRLYRKHPYRMPVLGTKETVSRLTAKQLHKKYHEWVRPNNLVLSVVGDVVPEQIREQLAERLEGLPTSQAALPRPRPEPKLQRPVSASLRRPGKNQAHIVIGFPGTTFKSHDHFGLHVLNTVLAGQGGRLFLELRDKESLAYTVTSSLAEGVEPGFFAVYMGTDGSKVDRALVGIKRELKRVVSKPITKTELKRAQRYLIGTHDLHLQRNSTVAGIIAFDEIYGLGFDAYLDYADQINRVTIDEVLHVAKKYLRLDRSVTVVVKP